MELFIDFKLFYFSSLQTLKTNVFDAVDMTFPNTDFASGVSYSDYKSHTANISDSFTWLNNLDKTLNQYSSRLQGKYFKAYYVLQISLLCYMQEAKCVIILQML